MKSYKSFLNEKRSANESVNEGIDHIDFGDFDDYVDDVDGFDKKDARKTFKETDPGAFNYVDTDWGDEFFEVEDYLKNNKIPFMYVNSMGESGIIWLAESVNEADISGSKISMLGTKIFNKIKIGSKFNTDTNVYTVTDYGRKANAFNEYIVTDKNGKEIGAKLSAMYSTTFELSSHPRSLVFNKQEMLNSITI